VNLGLADKQEDKLGLNTIIILNDEFKTLIMKGKD